MSHPSNKRKRESEPLRSSDGAFTWWWRVYPVNGEAKWEELQGEKLWLFSKKVMEITGTETKRIYLPASWLLDAGAKVQGKIPGQKIAWTVVDNISDRFGYRHVNLATRKFGIDLGIVRSHAAAGPSPGPV